MNADEARVFVAEHGIVMVSAKGQVPRLTEAIAGEPMRGSWWAHPKARQIFQVLRELEASPDILRCRLVDGHITLVHRRLWPALVRIADRFEPDRLARIRQEHSTSGRHVSRGDAYPKWVPAEVVARAERLTESEASLLLEPALRPAARSRAARA